MSVCYDWCTATVCVVVFFETHFVDVVVVHFLVVVTVVTTFYLFSY